MKTLTLKKWILTNFILFFLLVGTFCLSVMFGVKTIWPFGPLLEEEKTILWVSRVPRILLAALSGMALGTSGTAFQGLLQNSLADPYILGVSSGAALGSIIGLIFQFPYQTIPVLSFLSAAAAMMIVYRLASTRGQLSPHTLLLTGVILNAFLFAFILLLGSLVNFEQSQKIFSLLVGNLEAEEYSKIISSGILVILGLVLLTMEGHPLNLISAGPETAVTLGVDVNRHRRRIFFMASLMVGAVIPLTGLIGFVGLFVPHIARKIVGSDHRLSLPCAAWIGAILLMVCDTLARSLLVSTTYQTELPVGGITAVLGAPFFFFLLRKKSR